MEAKNSEIVYVNPVLKDDDAGKEIRDISTLMKERALRGYGEKTVVSFNYCYQSHIRYN